MNNIYNKVGSVVKRAMNINPKYILENYKVKNLVRGQFIGGKYKRIYFYHVRKTGGTSINHAMFSLFGDRDSIYSALNDSHNHRVILGDKVLVGWNKTLINEGNYYYAFSHIPMHKLQVKDDSYTFACFRNPLDRIISHYKMIKNYVDEGIQHPSVKTEGKYIGNSVDDFIEQVPKEHLLNQIYMFSKSFDINEAVDNIMGLSHFFLLDDFNNGIQKMASTLDINIKPIHIRKSQIKDVVRPKSLDKAMSLLAPEFKFYERLKREYDKRK